METQLEPITIMVVDDMPANLRLLQDMLHDTGYRVVAFPSGPLALQAMTRYLPDLILLDITMPEMSGYEVCERLKAEERTREIPVIFLSALSEVGDKVKAFMVGGVDYITKPFQFEEVHARVTTHLTLHQLRQALRRQNEELETLVQEQVQEISASQMAMIFALAKLAESRDDDTGTHLNRVQEFCRLLAEYLQEHTPLGASIDATFINDVYHASPLHDIGKVGIADAILLKPGPLSAAEFDVMKTHTLIGSRTLEADRDHYPRNTFIHMGISIARSHHERWNGTGYPDGLHGEEIPLAARIMSVADVYDALRSRRCYKDAFTHAESRRILLEGRGTQFDPDVLDAFLAQEDAFAHIRDTMDDE